MKTLRTLSFLLLVFSITMVSCKGKPKDMIVNKWQVTDAKTTGTQKMTEQDVAAMKQLMFEFTADGKLNLSGVPGGSKSGTYSISDDGKTLTTTSPEGQKSESEVSTLTKDKLVFTDRNSGLIISAEAKGK